MKKILLFVTLFSMILFTYGCDFTLTPKDSILIENDVNIYQQPCNALILVDNIKKKLDYMNAYSIKGKDRNNDFSLNLIKRNTLKESSLSFKYNNEDYQLDINLRNQILYYKVPLKNMGIDSDLNIGIKESIDYLITYIPLFLRSLGLNLFDLDNEELKDLINQDNYLIYIFDYFVNNGKVTYFIDDESYLIRHVSKDLEVEFYINDNYEINKIKVNENLDIEITYASEGNYVLKYPNEVSGLEYITITDIEKTLGKTFEELLG